MVFNYEPKATFTVQNEAQISVPPTVDFGKAASPAAPAAPATPAVPAAPATTAPATGTTTR
jgi:LemA protein